MAISSIAGNGGKNVKDVRILYAEDSNEKYISIARAMKSMGYKSPDMKSNVEDAVEQVLLARESGKPYDVIMTDMNYPMETGAPSTNQAGPEFIKKLHENGIETPIIEISSVNYNVPGAFRCVWFVESHNWERDLEQALKEALR